MKVIKITPLFLMLALGVSLFSPGANALNVTDDLDLNNGTAYNISHLSIGEISSSGKFLDINGDLGSTNFGIYADLSTQTLGAPMYFNLDQTSSTGGTALVIEAAAKFTKDITGSGAIYGTRWTLEPGTGLVQTQGSRNVIGNLYNFNSPILNGGSQAYTGIYLNPNSLLATSGTGNYTWKGLDVQEHTSALKLGNGDWKRYGVYIQDYSNSSEWNVSYSLYSEGGLNYFGGDVDFRNLTNGTHTVSNSDIIDAVQNPSGGDSFVYADWFDQDLNTTDTVTFDLVNVNDIYGDIGIDNSIELFDSGSGCMDFVVDGTLLLSLCADEINYGEDIVPEVNNTYWLGSQADWDSVWGGVRTNKLYAQEYYSNNSNQGIQGNFSVGSCSMYFESGLLISTTCSEVSPSPSPTPPPSIEIPNPEEEESRRIFFIP